VALNTKEPTLMLLRNRYFLLYLACAFLLGVPSFLVWTRQPFLITKNEFDFFLGLFGDFADMDVRLAMLGKCIHVLLVVGMGWAYFRLITDLSEQRVSLRWRDLVVPAALVLAISFHYQPWHSPDVFFYFGTGRLEAHYGLNPYKQVIADAPGWQADPAFQNVYPAWLFIITPYGPLFVKFIAAISWLSGGDDRIALLLVKVVFALCHVLNGWLVAGIARRLGMRERLAVLLYLISPVPLLDYIGWGHNDILMVSCVLAGLWAMLSRRHVLATLLLGVGAGFKYVPVVLCPYLFLYMTRGRKLAGLVPRVVGLSLLLGAVLVAPYLWYENGLHNFLRLFRGQDQQLHNILYLGILNVTVGSADEATQLAVLQVVKFVLKLIFLRLGTGVAYRLWRRGAAITQDHAFASIVVVLLLYFTIGSPEIHEWYTGWFLCFIFWVNNQAYYNLGMLLTTAFNALAILTVRCPPAIIHLAWSLWFLLMWAGLYYLWKQHQAGAWRPSPLFEATDSGPAIGLPEPANPVAEGLAEPVAS
jgi:hypothetical protein